MNQNVVSAEELRHCASVIVDAYKKAPQRRLLVCIAGRPGSGKTTVAHVLADEVRAMLFSNNNDNNNNDNDACKKNAVVVMPMDGYHLYRSVLHAMPNRDEAIARRGAEWTFDPRKLCRDLQAIRLPKEMSASEMYAAAANNNNNNNNTVGSGGGSLYDDVFVPSFDHGVGDPVEADVCVPGAAAVVIAEGNYLLYRGTPAWAEVNRCFDVGVFLACPPAVCAARLCRRHVAAWGVSAAEAMRRAAGSDATNGDLVDTTRGNATIVMNSVDVQPRGKL